MLHGCKNNVRKGGKKPDMKTIQKRLKRATTHHTAAISWYITYHYLVYINPLPDDKS